MPNTTLYLTVDLFLGDWNRSGDLWLCVLPHMIDNDTQTGTAAWLAQPPKGDAFSYGIVAYDDPALISAPNIVPVPLPDDLNLTVDMMNGGSAITIPRTTRFQILDPESLRHENLAPQEQTGATQNPDPLPFVRAYSKSMRDAFASGKSANTMAQSLRIAYWGGRPQRFTQKSVAPATDAGVMVLHASSGAGDPTVTNLHSMTGHMIRLGNRHSDLTRLKAVTDLKIVLHTGIKAGDGDVWSQQLVQTTGGPGIPAFFGGLTDTDMDPSALSLTWTDDFSKRAYARPVQTAFEARHHGSTAVFERRADSTVANRHHLGVLQRAIITLPASAGSLRTSTPDIVELRPCRLITGKIDRYRNAPDGGVGTATVLRFVAGKSDQDELEALLNADPDAFISAPRRARLIADGADLQVVFLGRYRFPWDQDPDSASERSTLLFHGVPPNSATCMLLIEPARGTAIVSAQRVPYTSQVGTARWEATPEGLPDVAFDGFLSPALDPAVGTALIVGEFLYDYDFELAHSISCIEDLATASCPHPALARPQDVTPEKDYLIDLTNYNALNVFSDGKPLNSGSELYPVFSRKRQPNQRSNDLLIEQVFQFRYRKRTTATQDDDPRVFFAGLYTQLAQKRAVTLELEHTYGNVLNFTQARSIEAYADFPVQLPDIHPGVPGAANSKATPAPELQIPFLTVDYTLKGGGESATLYVNTPLLDPRWAQDPLYGTFHSVAWQAVAELANAEQIDIEVACADFDVYQAQRRGGSLANGLVPLNQIFPSPISMTAALRAAARRWLLGNFDHNNPEALAIPFTPTTPVWSAAYVISFVLRVNRPNSTIPTRPAAAWDLRRMPGPGQVKPADEHGLAFPVATADAVQTYVGWLAGLAERAMSIATNSQNDAENHEVRAALHLDPTDPASQVAEAQPLPLWIAPLGTPAPWEGSALVTVCPLGFCPLQTDQWLGDQVGPLVRRYTRLMQMLLTLNVPEWSNHTVTDWQKLLQTLERLADVGGTGPLPARIDHLLDSGYVPPGALARLIKHIADLTFPMPAPDNTSMSAEMRQVVTALRTPDTPSARHARRRVLWQVMRDVGIFDTAKAFLAVRCVGEKNALPQDFFDVASDKIPADQPVDHDVKTYREASLAEGASGFEFLDLLQEGRFGERFKYSSFQLRRFEHFFQHLKDPKWQPPSGSDTAYFIPRRLLVPGGDLDQSANTDVFLAARSPVIKPIHLATGPFPQVQLVGDFNKTFDPSVPARFDFDSLKRGALVSPVSNNPYVEVVLRATPRPRSGAADEYVLAAAFIVQGDDEAQDPANPLMTLDLDRFYIGAIAPQTSAMKTERVPGAQTFVLYQSLATALDPRTLTGMADIVLSPQVIDDTSEWLIAATPPTTPTIDAPAAHVDAHSKTLSVDWPGHNAYGWVSDAVLMKMIGAQGAATVNSSAYVLLVTREVVVWDSMLLGLVQSRNLRDPDPARDFAAEFGERSDIASDTAGYQPIHEFVSTLDAVQVVGRSHSLAEIVKACLQNRLIPTDTATGEARQWRGFDLTVTVCHDQQLPISGTWFDPSQRTEQPLQRDMGRSGFPLVIHHFSAHDTKGQNEPIAFFPDGVSDFGLDFQWTSSSNLHFFRISEVLIKVSG